MKRLLALASLALIGGCSDPDEQPADLWYPLPECPDIGLTRCDTLASICQERLLKLAACMYGVEKVPNVPIQVRTEEELIDELESAAAEGEPDDEDASLPYAEQALVQLGLAQPGDFTGEDSTANLVERISGVYIDAERGITIVDRGEPKDDEESNALLLHELVHALQDSQYGLGAWRDSLPSTEDSTLALRAVTEGQATYLQFRALLAMTNRDVSKVDWPTSLDNFQADLLDEAYKDPSPYLASIVTFPYAYGAQLSYQAWTEDGVRFHEMQFDKPLLTTYEVASAVDGDGDRLDEIAFTAPTSVEDAGLTLQQETALGAFLTELQLRASGVTSADAVELAQAWRGDRLFIYSQGDSAAWLWELEFADVDEAAAFVERDFQAGVVAENDGARAFVAGGDGEPPESVLAAGRAYVAGEAP